MKEDKKPFKSKKFIGMFIGVIFTSIFTIASMVLIALVPSISVQIVELVSISLASINGLICLYALGQSAVDWKISSQNKKL
jgi:hypothetical protein